MIDKMVIIAATLVHAEMMIILRLFRLVAVQQEIWDFFCKWGFNCVQ